ncbi:MAG: CrcB family protein, partial [Gammaproteobacteria bacterium]
MNIILIGIGGALGAILRHIVNDLISKFLPFQIPLGILSVNIFGCFLIGLLM